jgi:Spy/CpxP family protein refolding chaperone
MRQRIWFFIALFFIAVNAVMMVKFFLNRRHAHMRVHDGRDHGPHMQEGRRDRRGGPHGRHHFYMTNMFADSLGFSQRQKESLMAINAALDIKKDSIIKESEKTKEALADEIYAEESNNMKVDSLIKKISVQMEIFNHLRAENANVVRNMCSPEQKKKLARLMNDFKHERNGERNNH